MATAPLLGAFFGDWPAGLTREDNLIDLAWHEREFTARRSFSWIVRDTGGTYIGCFYVFPQIGARRRAEAALWLCDMSDRLGIATSLKADLDHWLSENLPPQVAVTWSTSPELE